MSISSQLVSALTITRNSNASASEANTKKEGILPSLGVLISSEIAYALAAVASVVEAVAAGVFTLATLPIALVSDKPLQNSIEWLNSSAFAVVWSLVNLRFNFEVPNLFIKESQVRNFLFGASNSPVDVNSPVKSTFVEVLNVRKYILGEKEFEFSKASKPIMVKRNAGSAAELQARFKKLKLAKKEISYEVKDFSSEEAIETRNGNAKIALNFANEHHAGGGPSCYLDKDLNKFVFLSKSARAQEESLVKHTDLMDSLTQLAHVYEQRNEGDIARSFYEKPFDSKKEAYVSDNHLFALRAKTETGAYKDFEDLEFVEPAEVSFVTSAAKCVGSGTTVTKGDKYYQNQYERIKTHLMAAAEKALFLKEGSPSKPVELILGAFGCGAFSPENAKQYATWTAEIYKDLLPEYKGFFDKVTFAVPKFGITDPKNAMVVNFESFRETFSKD